MNHYYGHWRGRVVVKTEGKRYWAAVRSKLDGVLTLKHQLGLVLLVCPPDGRKRDLDNVLKCLLDSLTKAGLWEDDGQIDHLALIRGPISRPNGKICLALSDATEQQAFTHHVGEALATVSASLKWAENPRRKASKPRKAITPSQNGSACEDQRKPDNSKP